MSLHGQPLRQDYVAPDLMDPVYSQAATYDPFSFAMPQCVSCAEKVAASSLCNQSQIRGLGASADWRATVNAKWPNVDPCIVRGLAFCPGQECPPPPLPTIPDAEPPDTYGLDPSYKRAFVTYGLLGLVVLAGGYAIYRSNKR